MWKGRENAEWINGWIENAPNTDCRRWCLVGDSIARQYRGKLQEICKPRNIIVDVFATSFQIEDSALEYELKHFFSYNEYTYEFIIVSIGPHHGLSRRICDNKNVYDSYREHYNTILRLLSGYCLSVILVTGTPLASKRNLEIFDEWNNMEVRARNRLVQEISNQCNLAFIDHYKLVITQKDKFIYKDEFHFSSKTEQEILASSIYEGMVSAGYIRSNGTILDQKFPDWIRIVSDPKDRVNENLYWEKIYESSILESEWNRLRRKLGLRHKINYFIYFHCFQLLDQIRPSHILELGVSSVNSMVIQYVKYFNLNHSLILRENYNALLCGELSSYTHTYIEPNFWDHQLDLKDIKNKTYLSAWKYDCVIIHCPRGGYIMMENMFKLLADKLEEKFSIFLHCTINKNIKLLIQGLKSSLKEKGIFVTTYECVCANTMISVLLPSSVYYEYIL